MSICINPLYLKNENQNDFLKISKNKKLNISNQLLKKCDRKKYNLEDFNELFPSKFKCNLKKRDTKQEKPLNSFNLVKMDRSGISLKEKRKLYLSQIYSNNKKTSQVCPPEFSLKLFKSHQVYPCPFQSDKSNYSTEVINIEYLSDSENNIKEEERKKFYKLFQQ